MSRPSGWSFRVILLMHTVTRQMHERIRNQSSRPVRRWLRIDVMSHRQRNGRKIVIGGAHGSWSVCRDAPIHLTPHRPGRAVIHTTHLDCFINISSTRLVAVRLVWHAPLVLEFTNRFTTVALLQSGIVKDARYATRRIWQRIAQRLYSSSGSSLGCAFGTRPQ